MSELSSAGHPIRTIADPSIVNPRGARILFGAASNIYRSGYHLGRASSQIERIGSDARHAMAADVLDVGAALSPRPDESGIEQRPLRDLAREAALAGLTLAVQVGLVRAGEHLSAERPDGTPPSKTAQVLGYLASAIGNGMPRR